MKKIVRNTLFLIFFLTFVLNLNACISNDDLDDKEESLSDKILGSWELVTVKGVNKYFDGKIEYWEDADSQGQVRFQFKCDEKVDKFLCHNGQWKFIDSYEWNLHGLYLEIAKEDSYTIKSLTPDIMIWTSEIKNETYIEEAELLFRKF